MLSLEEAIEHVDIRGNKPLFPLSHEMVSTELSAGILSWLTRQPSTIQKNVQFLGVYSLPNHIQEFEPQLKKLWKLSFFQIWQKNKALHEDSRKHFLATTTSSSPSSASEWQCSHCQTYNLITHNQCIMCNNEKKFLPRQHFSVVVKKSIQQEAQEFAQWRHKEEWKQKEKENKQKIVLTKSEMEPQYNSKAKQNHIYNLFFHSESEQKKTEGGGVPLSEIPFSADDEEPKEPRFLFSFLDDPSKHSQLLIIDKINQTIELYNPLFEKENFDPSTKNEEDEKKIGVLAPSQEGTAFLQLIAEHAKKNQLRIPVEVYNIYEQVKKVSQMPNWNIRIKKDENLFQEKLQTNLMNLYYFLTKMEKPCTHPLKISSPTPFRDVFTEFFA